MKVVETYLLCYVIITVSGLVFVTGRFFKKRYSSTLLRGELHKLKGHENARFIDVRSFKERERNALANTEHVPYESIQQLSLHRNTVIVTYCNSGIRAWQAAEDLKAVGYSQIYCYSGTDLELERERRLLREKPDMSKDAMSDHQGTPA